MKACDNCGCTDIEVAVWVDANTGAPTDGDPPLDRNVFCPQCEMHSRGWVEVAKPKPYE